MKDFATYFVWQIDYLKSEELQPYWLKKTHNLDTKLYEIKILSTEPNDSICLLDKEVCFKILQLSDEAAAKDIEIFYL